MKTRLVALAISLLAIGGVAGVAGASPGPNDHNEHGLCTAYFNGQKNGHDGGSPGPFAVLEQEGRDRADHDGVDNDGDGEVDEDGEGDDLSPAEAAFNRCDGIIIGGNPEHGRYVCVQDSDANTEGNQVSCEDNPAPGNSGG